MITCETTEAIIAVIRALNAESGSTQRPLVLGGWLQRRDGRRPARPDRGAARQHRHPRRRRHPARRGGRGLGRRRRRRAGARPRRPGMPLGHPRLGGRDPGAERRRLRRGGRRHHPAGQAARPAHRRGPLGGGRRARIRLPDKHSQELRRRDRARGRVRPRRRTAAARRCATASWPTTLGAEPGARADPAEVRDAVLALRRRKGMVLDDGRPRHLERRLVLHQPGGAARGVRADPGARRRHPCPTTRRRTG